MQDLSRTGKTTVETAGAAGDQNGSDDTLAPCPQHTSILSRWQARVCKGNHPRLLICEPLCSKDDELKKKNLFQIMNIVRFFKNDGGYFTRYMLEKITDSCLSVKDEKFSFLPNYKNT